MSELVTSHTQNGPDKALLLSHDSDRLNAIITPGLVHEMNNLLTGIYFNLETMRDLFDSNHPASEALKEISQGVERINELLGRTAQIHLNTAERELNYHDLEALASSQLDLLRILFPKTYRIAISAPARPAHVHVAEFPFRVALLNVATTARDIAREPKSEIYIKIHDPESLASISTAKLEGNVAVGVSIPNRPGSELELKKYLENPDTPLSRASVIIREMGGNLIITDAQGANPLEVLLVLPEVEINH